MKKINVNNNYIPPVEEMVSADSDSSFAKVFTKVKEETNIQINPKFVYCTIPKDYVCTYHKLINYLADAGKDIIDDCSFACKGDGKKLFNCWGLFQSACAAYQQEDYTKASFYFNYVNNQLEDYYKDLDKEVYAGGNYYPITPDGRLKALCSCNNTDIKFYVDSETKRLYEEYLDSKVDNEIFVINDDGNLQVESNQKV